MPGPEQSPSLPGYLQEIEASEEFKRLDKLQKLPIGVENQAFFRRGEVGDSMNFLTAEMKEKMDMITEQKLHCYGLKL
ncbi:hypothetical protein OIU77_014015 [Salix suchowensis]|uniref:Sulfotransferase n=1 Tax=Salix suchowensis TaxID=1278906 RepID=A0ABQ8ZVU4_9ROSI|nr:hypothetical protein OIU77_014015 [Salix suchowensis]